MFLFMARGANHVVDRLFYTESGSMFISILFGFALAAMFQKACKDRKCIVIKAPPMKEISDMYYKNGDDCFKYTPKVVPCNGDA